MAGNEILETPPLEIPQDATVARQSSWAWQLPAAPWLLFLLAATFFDVITIGILPVFLACVVVVPKYISWRKALYILTDDHLVVFHGGILGRRRYDLPIAEFAGVEVRPGIFGGTLGYRALDISLRDGGMVVLAYMPQDSPIVGHIRSRLGQIDTDGSFPD